MPTHQDLLTEAFLSPPKRRRLYPDWSEVDPAGHTVELTIRGEYQGLAQSARSWARHHGYRLEHRFDEDRLLLHVRFVAKLPVVIGVADPRTHRLFEAGVVGAYPDPASPSRPVLQWIFDSADVVRMHEGAVLWES